MTQEQKQLLLKDLCARMPYGVFVKHKNRSEPIICDIDCHPNLNDLEDVRTYLRPLSSITEEEKRHISKMTCLSTYDNGVVHDMTYPVYTPYYVMEDCLSYLRSIHVDYSGLIEKGLALEAQPDMYKIK